MPDEAPQLDPDDAQTSLDADFHAWMLKFRHIAGRSLSAEEHALARVAHCTGFQAGFNFGAEVMRQYINDH